MQRLTANPSVGATGRARAAKVGPGSLNLLANDIRRTGEIDLVKLANLFDGIVFEIDHIGL